MSRAQKGSCVETYSGLYEIAGENQLCERIVTCGSIAGAAPVEHVYLILLFEGLGRLSSQRP